MCENLGGKGGGGMCAFNVCGGGGVGVGLLFLESFCLYGM